MLPKADTDGFNRLLVSLGVLLVGLAVVGPWFILRSTDVLTIKERDLDALTPTADRAIRSRQHLLANITPEIWVVAVIVAAVGVLLVCWGAKRMHAQQKLDDRRREHEVDRLALELQSLITPATPDQIKEKIDRESGEPEAGTPTADAHTDVESGLPPDSGGQAQTTPDPTTASEDLGHAGDAERQHLVLSRANLRIEELVVGRLRVLQSATVEANISVQPVGRVVDALVRMESPYRLVFVEIKVVRRLSDILTRLRQAVDQLAPVLLMLTRVDRTTEVSGLIVMVYDGGPSDANYRALARQAAQRRDGLQHLGIDVQVVTLQDLDAWIPALL